jgi:lysophospholipase L1-like esterase
VRALNSEREVASGELGTRYLDYLDVSSVFDDTLFLSDRVRLNADGQARMAHFIAAALGRMV